MKRVFIILVLVSFLLPTKGLAADVGVINHVMGNKIECGAGKGCEVIGATSVQFVVPKGQTGAKHKFSTLDQLIFDAGTFKVEQRIVEDETKQVVAAIKPNMVTVRTNQEVRHFNINWDFGSKWGVFTYQILVDDKVIGSFKISILAGK